MTDLEALYLAILSRPDDDTPRLLYADMLEEIGGQEERAEFIRVQVELARGLTCKSTVGYPPEYICERAKLFNCTRCLSILREREFLGKPVMIGGGFWTAPAKYADIIKLFGPIQQPEIGNVEWSRGFISSLTCSWSDWLAHHERLYWHPKQTADCDAITCRCKGTGRIPRPLMVKVRCECRKGLPDHIQSHQWVIPCNTCHGTGTVERSLLDTAQPITTVKLTTAPTNIRNENQVWIGEHCFDRVKCWKCKDTPPRPANPLDDSELECPECHGQPLNEWTCPAWPTIRFTMPAEEATLIPRTRRAISNRLTSARGTSP